MGGHRAITDWVRNGQKQNKKLTNFSYFMDILGLFNGSFLRFWHAGRL